MMKRMYKLYLSAAALMITTGAAYGGWTMVQEAPLLFELKEESKKVVSVEYGSMISAQADAYLELSALQEEQKEKLLKETKVEVSQTLEKEKSYPKVGVHQVILTYKEQELKVTVSVEDHTPPSFTKAENITCMQGEKPEYDDHVRAEDLSKVTLNIEDEALNINKAGTYDITVKAVDTYGNTAEQKLKVTVKAKKKAGKKEQKKMEQPSKKQPSVPVKKETVSPAAQKPSKQEPEQQPAQPEPAKQPVVHIEVPYHDQYAANAPMGCEGASLLQALQGKGYASGISLTQFLKDIPKTADGNPYHGFVESPFEIAEEGYQSIFPSALVPFGNRYGACVDNSGASTDSLISELKNGNPSVVYVTVCFEAPVWRSYAFGKAPTNLHVMTLTGYDPNNGKLQVMDPAGKGSYWVSRELFERSYCTLYFAITVH